jgi:hypothetical protein
MLIYGNTPSDIRKMMWKNKWKVFGMVGAVVLVVGLASTKAQAEEKKELTALEQFFDALGSGNIPSTGSGMDDDAVNPGNDKIIAEQDSYTELPYNGFRWDWHIESCESNKSYDGTINKVGTFAILEQAKIDAGGIPCPVGHPRLHPSWDYDWKAHILFAEADRLLKELHQQRQNQYGPQAGPKATRIQYTVE